MGSWHTYESIQDLWPDAPTYEDFGLNELLEVAKEQVLAFAGIETLEAPDVPASYRMAQYMQARNIWNSSKVDPASGGLGEDTFAIRVYPLDWMVRQIIRPKRAIGGMF